MLALVLCGAAVSGAWDLFFSVSEGYTHYRAKDLNEVLTLLERTTQDKGFNPYQVSQFDGHPQTAVVVGWTRGPWRLGVETEFWVEEFHQSEVPFDLEEAGRDYRITCDTLRNPAHQTENLYGCVDARETFNFLPITFQTSYGLSLLPWLRTEAGYGIGVMAGSASIELKTEYFGNGAAPNDKTRFDVWPGVNPVQKAWLDLEALPWKWMGITTRFGYRMSKLAKAEVRNKEGESLIFRTVFPKAKDGARLYIQTMPDPVIPQSIYLGTEADAREQASHDGSHFHLVQGDFTGWFASLKLNLYWRGI